MTTDHLKGTANPVVIELDTPPAKLTPLTSGDYVERCVVSALHQPALQLVSTSPRCVDFEFVIRGDARFSDGLAVQPEHVLQTLVDSAASPLWARFIRYLERAEVVGERLRLTMRHQASFYPAMLRAVDFAPTHPDCQIGNGPYRIGADFDAESQYYHLSPNPYFPGAADRPDVVFVVRTDVNGAPDRFADGECDITCGTAFPLDRLAEWRGSPLLHSSPSGVFMQLEPGRAEDSPLADPLVRTVLLDCLDLPRITTSFAGGLKQTACPVAASRIRDVSLPSIIRIGYHDFYPNRLVLERLSREWREKLSIHTELVARDYADESRDGVDASFVLRYAAFDHPYAFFDQCATTVADPDLDRHLQRFAAGEPGSREAIESRLRSQLPVIRLFEVIGHWLADPHVTGFGWPSNAMFDFTNLRRTAEVRS